MRISYWSSDVCSSDLPYFEVMRPPGEIGIEPVDLVRERFEDFKALKHGFESRARFHPREIIAETEMRTLPEGHQREGDLAVDVEERSEARRVGTAGVSTCRSRWSP